MNHRAKKSLGQHFLKSQRSVADIVDAGDIHVDDIVLEIGPGKGILTKKLLLASRKVIAIEKDPLLVSFLKEKFETEIQEGTLDIIEKDILDFDPETLRSFNNSYKIVANIPYYITGAIIKKFLESTYQPKHMVLLIQKEVAQRIMARDNKESILSISVKVYGKPHYIKKIPARFFSPVPKVDSAILSIEHISKDFFTDIDERVFFTFLKAGFAHKRKLLIKNLENTKNNKNILKKTFSLCTISEKTRAENMTLENWKCLTKHLKK